MAEMIESLWCLTCGGPLAGDNQEKLFRGDLTEETGMYSLMRCVRCLVPEERKGYISPDARRIENRLLYWLIHSGGARLTLGAPPRDLTTHGSTPTVETARKHFSTSVRGINSVYVATHSRLRGSPQHYVLGHLKATGVRCDCELK